MKYFTAWFVQPYVRRKMQRSSFYKWEDVTLFLPPGVFHPGYFYSTKYLLQFILKQHISGKQLLELGAGNGLISIASAKRGAKVSASDISKEALRSLRDNARTNHVGLTIIESDLFEQIPDAPYDYIVINPPFYPLDPRNDLERAWYCGQDYAYFRKMFEQLPVFMHPQTKVYMILSEDTGIGQIENLAGFGNLRLEMTEKKQIFYEWNYIYEIVRA